MKMKKLLIFVGVIVAFCLYCIISNEKELRAMATTEGRQEVIAEKYEGAVITSEKEVEGYIISAYEIREEHGYAVFKPVVDGKYDLLTYNGSPREKSWLVNGTLDIPEGNSYEVYVCGDENIEYLDVTIRDTYTGELLQDERIFLEDSCIAVLKRDPVVWAWQTDVIGYDADG
ncbi:MAG: hypothetical protein IJE57_04205, partial [Anaerotignum sp.]|nr:hypothetical protein [Anaerotignum sp.]